MTLLVNLIPLLQIFKQFIALQVTLVISRSQYHLDEIIRLNNRNFQY